MNITYRKVKDGYPYGGLALLIFIAFIALGMPDGILGIAWPSMRENLSVPLDSIGFLLFALVSGYLVSSFLSGPLVSHFGQGQILAGSCLLTGTALIGYTIMPEYWMIVLLGVVAGLGAGAIDASLNSYVATHFNENFMQWMHASYGIGITLGPIIMTVSLTSFNSWRIGYVIVGVFQIILAVCFFITLKQWNKNKNSVESNEQEKVTDCKTPLVKTLLQKRVWLSALLFFIYAGCESALGTWAYTLLVKSRGVLPEIAGFSVSSYLGAFSLGRIAAGLYAKKIGINYLIFISIVTALICSIFLWINLTNVISFVAIVLIGFAIAPIFPALVSGTARRVGVHFAANTIGIQMAAASLGIALLPSTMGVLAKKFSLEIIPVFLLILFVILLFLYILAVKRSTPLSNSSASQQA